jgi:HK97 family phage major capsid protein
MDKILELQQKRAAVARDMKAVLDRAERAPDKMSRRDSAWLREAERQLEALEDEIKAAKAAEARTWRSAGYPAPGDLDPRDLNGPTLADEGGAVVLTREQRVADWLRTAPGGRRASAFDSELDPDRASLGRLVRGMVTGRWDGAELEQRALSEGTDSAGGYLTPEPLAARFIDRVRNAMQVMRAGAQTVPMTSDKEHIPRLTGGATVGWKSEGAAISESDMTFDRVSFTARTLPILVKMSQELFDDLTPEAADGIEREMSEALALELDRVCLRGSGTAPEPRGIRNQSGITIQSLGANGATPTWDNVVDGVANVRNANLEPSAILWASRTATTLGKVKDTTGQYLTPPAALDGIPRLVTNQIPVNLTQGTSTDTSGATSATSASSCSASGLISGSRSGS